MRVALIVVCFALARVASATCIDDCRRDFGGSGDDYASCVADCGVCGDDNVDEDEDCDDGNTVNGDCCDSTCHFEPAGSPCAGDSDDVCVTCDGEGDCSDDDDPSTVCREPSAAGDSTMLMRSPNDPDKAELVWKWRREQDATPSDWGDPRSDATYSLCIYDASGQLATVGTSTGAAWSEKGSSFRYRDPKRGLDGASVVTLQQRRGKTKILFKAGGSNLEVPELDLLESPLTVQLRRSGSSACWGAQFSFSDSRRHAASHFKDRSDVPAATTTSTTTTTTTTASTATTATTATTVGPGGPAPTTTTLPGVPASATVEVTVVDASSTPVSDAEVTIDYADGSEDSDFTDDTGVVTFTAQPVSLAADVSV